MRARERETPLQTAAKVANGALQLLRKISTAVGAYGDRRRFQELAVTGVTGVSGTVCPYDALGESRPPRLLLNSPLPLRGPVTKTPAASSLSWTGLSSYGGLIHW